MSNSTHDKKDNNQINSPPSLLGQIKQFFVKLLGKKHSVNNHIVDKSIVAKLNDHDSHSDNPLLANSTSSLSLNNVAKSVAERASNFIAENMDDDFAIMTVEDIMIPRADIIAIAEDATLEEIESIFAQKIHTRIPIYRDSLDRVIGFIHIKDLFCHIIKHKDNINIGKNISVKEIIRSILVVPASIKLPRLLEKMRHAKIHIAVILDEYGGTDGLVTIEDIIEQIVGEIQDEHDNPEATNIKALNDNEWIVQGRAEIAEFTEITGIKLDIEDEEECNTMGGLITLLLHHLPRVGEKILYNEGQIEFEALEVDPRQVHQIRVKRLD